MKFNRTRSNTLRRARREKRRQQFAALESRILLAVIPADFSQTVVASAIANAIAMEIAPDGKLFVTTGGTNGGTGAQTNNLEVWSNGTPSVKLQENFFQNSPLSIDNDNEGGMLGIAFHPQYATNRYVYIYYGAMDGGKHNRISRFKANATGDLAVPYDHDNNAATPDVYEDIIMELSPHSAGNHHGGAIHFGPSGAGEANLYIATGDNANNPSGGQQQLNIFHGKILRINVNGDSFPADTGHDWAVPAGQPTSFPNAAGPTTGIYQAIYAIGLRNPFTTAMHPGTGRMFANDVGNGNIEEINDIIGGLNYGYPATDGGSTNAYTTLPFYYYTHDGEQPNGSAIAGGDFYYSTTPHFPSSYPLPTATNTAVNTNVNFNNVYFFSDYGNSRVWTIDLTTKQVSEFGSGFSSPVDIKVDLSGNLYVLNRGGGGQVLRIAYNAAPPAILTQPQSQTQTYGDSAVFTVSAAGSSALTYQWQRADSATPNSFSNIGSATGTTYTLNNVQAADNGDKFRVVVTDAVNQQSISDVATLTASANHAPVAGPIILTGGLRNGKFDAGTLVTFSGSASDQEQGSLGASSFTWRVDLITSIDSGDGDNDGLPGLTRPFNNPFGGTTTGSFTSPTISQYVFPDVAHLITLTVTDAQGRTDTEQLIVYPNTVNLTVASNPSGLKLSMDGNEYTAPKVFGSVVGWIRPVNAATTQTINGTFYDFASWSDGGAASHNIVTPQSNTSYTANYSAGGFSAKVNFQVGTAVDLNADPELNGYSIDSGLIYASRGNGFTYGWSEDVTAGARNRNLVADERYDTLIHMQQGTNKIWEILLTPNATYTVHLVAGDAGFLDSINSFNIEGTAVTDTTPNAASALYGNHEEYTVTVTVGADGKLTITPTGTNAKINYIDISNAQGGDVTPPTVSAKTPNTGAVVANSAVNIDVTFSEAVTSVDATDLVLTGAGAASAVKGTPTNQGGNVWRFPVTGLVDGAVNVSLAPDANDIEDAAGNDLANVTWSFSVGIPPTVTNRNPTAGATIGTTSVNIDVTFSEAVTGVDATDLVLTGAAAGSAVKGTPTNQGGNLWRFPVSGLVDGALNISLAPDANDIEDAVGTDLANLTWSYTIAVPPTVTSKTPDQGATVQAGGINIDVTFSEAVTGVDATDLVLTGTGAASAVKGTPTNQGNNIWRFPVSNLVTGTVIISLAPDANDIEDSSGNDLANVTWSITVAADTTAPTVQNAASANPNPVTGTSTALSVLGADNNGEPGLIYTWSVLTKPAGAPDPTFTVNGTNASKSTTANFTYSGNYTFRVVIKDAGNNTISSDTASIAVTFGFAGITGGTSHVTFNGGSIFTVFADSGTVNFASDLSAGGKTVHLNLVAGASAVLNSSQTLASISINAGSTLNMPAANPHRVLYCTTIFINATGKLDLNNNDMIVDYGTNGSSLGTIETYLRAGRNGGSWNGNGIRSTSVAANPGSFALNALDNNQTATPYNTFNGISVASHKQVLIRYTYVADIDLDGRMTSNDAIAFGTFYHDGQTASHYMGDINYDGTVNSNDAILFATVYNETAPQIAMLPNLVITPLEVGGSSTPVTPSVAAAPSTTVAAKSKLRHHAVKMRHLKPFK